MSSLGGLEFPYHTLHKRKPPHRTEKGGKKENKVRIPSRLGKASGAIVRKERSCHAEWREGRGRRQNINDLRAEARLSYRQKGAARAGNHMPFHPNLRECRASVWCARVWAWFPELGIRAGPGWGALGGEGGQCRSHTVVVPGGSLTSTTPPPRRAPPHFSQGRLCTRYEPVLSEPRTTHPPSVGGGGGAFPERAATPFLFSVWYWRLWRLVRPDRLPPMHHRPHIPATGFMARRPGDEQCQVPVRPVPSPHSPNQKPAPSPAT